MSDILSYIKNNSQESQRLVGVKYEQLEQLIHQAIALHTQKQQEIEEKKIRIINKGGGRKVKLSTSEQILLTLVYLRHLTTFQLLGIQFGVSESTANDTFNYWFPLLQEILPSSLLEQVKKNASDYEIVQELLTDYELIVDSSEQARERPEEYAEQKKYYSAKKKSHTFKNQITVLPNGQDIVDIIAGEPGRGSNTKFFASPITTNTRLGTQINKTRAGKKLGDNASPKSDITLFRKSQKEFEPNQKFQGDKGYIGEPSIKTPTKKPKKGELTKFQKEKNKEMAKERIFVEHLIRFLKIFRVASERFRLNPCKYKKIIMTICGLVRLRIGALVLPV